MSVVRAPGKAILCGEYAVLEGAPAISVAVDRYVRAQSGADGGGVTSPFVAAALRHAARALPDSESVVERLSRQLMVTSNELYEGGAKIGLGSSAAVTAAVVGLVFAELNVSLEDRARIFAIADAAHAEAQGVVGSGIDVATSVYGGAIRFVRHGGAPVITPVSWPADLRISFVFSGQSASTPDLVARVRRLRDRDTALHTECMNTLTDIAGAFSAAISDGDARAAVTAAARWQPALAKLGHAADAPIVTPFFENVARIASTHGAAAKPSGAGGGDLGVVLSTGDVATRAIHAALASVDIHVLPLCVGGPALGLSEESSL
jgi:phosphomevalonate kinase